MARLQFVNIEDPLRTASAHDKERQAAYAHAARAGHTKRRRQQKQQAQSSQGTIANTADNEEHRRLVGFDSGAGSAGPVSASGRRNREAESPDDDHDAREFCAIPTGRNGELSWVANALTHGVQNSPIGFMDLSRDRDPFKSFARSFSPMELYLLQYYTTDLIPELDKKCRKLRHISPCPLGHLRSWMSLVFGNGSLLDGVLMTASRHLSILSYLGREQAAVFTGLAMQYKVQCLRELQDIITESKPGMAPTDNMVASVLNLTLDEFVQGDSAMAIKHMSGANTMVKLRGGAQNLGVNGFLEVIFHKFAGESGFALGPRERQIDTT